MKRYTPDCSMHMSHEIAFMRETPGGAYMEYQDHLPVKMQRDNLAIRVTELEQLVNEYFYKFQKVQDASKHLLIMNDRDKAEIARLNELLSQKENKLADSQGAEQVKASGFILGYGNGCDEYIFKAFYGQEIKIGDRLFTTSGSKSGGE